MILLSHSQTLTHVLPSLCGLLAGFTHSVLADPTASTAPSSSGLPRWVDGDGSDEAPWGDRTCETDPEDVPDTGVVRKYEWTVERKIMAPDGFEQELLVVNGMFPGPQIEANWGDIIEVTVHNNITAPEEGTAIHWHGIHQLHTPWMDGVSGITQCPIVPGNTFTYRWRASTYGTTWWHGHHALQYAGGLWGPIIIHGPTHVDYDIDLGPVSLSDYYHRDYEGIAMGAISNGNDNATVPASANHLINGMNSYNCSIIVNYTCTDNAPTAKFKFQSGKTHKIRLINTSTQAYQIFSIDNHKLIVTTMDMVPVEPYEVDWIILGVGARAEVLVKANGDPTKAYTMRTDVRCATTYVWSAKGTIYYDQAPDDAVPVDNATPNPYTLTGSGCEHKALGLMNPVYKKPLPQPDMTVFLSVTYAQNASGNHLWYMNGIPFMADWSRPLLLEAADGNADYLSQPQHILSVIPDGVRHVRINVQSNFSVHPMHIHGGDFQIVAEGPGTWNGTIPNRDNPARADTELLRRNGYLVIQIDTKNPGAWSFHCHTAWHASPGLIANLLVRPKAIKQYDIPQSVRDGCKAWGDYEAAGSVNALPFDSGLK
ncbi:laccase-1 precursor [Colletotrichum plurivorum]|uniref:Laccase-1 n=1 Tax=Colletotrichum plurivorum TaxID=2175906 RepID=A0A8H6KBM6_9PEZI|nr:laccase-1 precursor [Colletotrichum plurivorum]